MNTFRNILVAVDFSPSSRAALLTAMRLASRGYCTVTVAHILDPSLAAAMRRVHGFDQPHILQNVEDSLRRFLTDSKVPLDRVHLLADTGHAFQGLVDACESQQADLLVMGTKGSSQGINHVGVIASMCVRKAPADVLLVHQESNVGFKKILACVDFSPTSERVVKMAKHLAEYDAGSVNVMHVLQSALAMSIEYGGYLPAMPDFETDSLRETQEQLVEFVEPILSEGLPVTWSTEVRETTNVRDALANFAYLNHCDLIVVGTKGKGWLGSALMGTTAEKMIRHAHCSVLVAKSPAKPERNRDNNSISEEPACAV